MESQNEVDIKKRKEIWRIMQPVIFPIYYPSFLLLLLILLAFLLRYQLRMINIIAIITIIIPAQNNKLLIPSTSPAVGSNGYCEAHSSKWPSASSPVNVWFGSFSLPHVLDYLDACWCGYCCSPCIPSPKDTPAMAIPMIKSSFGFVIVVVSYLYLFLLC